MELADVTAFTDLVRRHQAAVVAVAYAIVRDRELAHDLTQEAFVKAWRSLDQLREPARAGAWLAGIVRFLARDQRRLARRRAALRERHDLPAATAATPLEQVVAREDDALLAAVVGELAPTYREPLLLHHVAGCSVAEIAATLELSEDAVKQRLSRGRSALRESLARAGADEPRFAAAALALAPPASFTGATVHAAVHQAPPGASKASIMLRHPILSGALVAGAVAVGGLELATSRGGDRAAPPAVGGSAAAGDLPDPRARPATSSAAATTTPGTTATAPAGREQVARLQAIRAARARAATSAPPPAGAPPLVYDFAGETLVAGAEPAPPPPIADGAPLTKATIRAALATARPQVIACYEAALATAPTLAGTLTLRVVVEGEPAVGGVIADAEVVPDASTIADPALAACVLDAVAAIGLPAPARGGTVTVHYPYTFAPR